MASPLSHWWAFRSGSPDWTASPVTVAATAAIATATIFIVSRDILWPKWAKVLKSPLKTTLPRMKKEEVACLSYQPDQFPGARDVETPYGSIRVYEFGPEDGEKVLFVHGITTSCMTLTHLANGLVERGCRVMLFDLFGRGFTDGVGDLPHDERLYVSQMLLCLASSQLAWTGNNAIRVVGYSLGGGIAAHFADTFPHLVSSLVLLAPAGLIRAERFGRITRFVFSSGAIPEAILHQITSQRLQQPIASSRKVPKTPLPKSLPTTPGIEVAAAELGSPESEALAQPLENRVTQYVRWMVAHHRGFVPSFMSCIRYAPLVQRHDVWRSLAKRKPGSTIILLAERDEIISKDDYENDGLPLIGGKENVVWKVLPGSHDFVMTHPQEILQVLDHEWNKQE